MNEIKLIQYVIYDHPSDYPEHYVVRRWFIEPAADEPVRKEKEVYLRTKDLRLIKAHMDNLGLVCIRGILERDDPCILEVWM